MNQYNLPGNNHRQKQKHEAQERYRNASSSYIHVVMGFFSNLPPSFLFFLLELNLVGNKMC